VNNKVSYRNFNSK